MTKLDEAISAMLIKARKDGFDDGQNAADHMHLDERGYSAIQTVVACWDYTSLLDLRRRLREANWYIAGDHPGRLFKQTCRLLYLHKGDNMRQAVVLFEQYTDI